MTTILTKFRTNVEHFVKKFLHHSQVAAQSSSAKKVEVTRQNNPIADYNVSQQEYDAFRMKAIILLKKDAIPGLSIQSLFQNPVQVNVGHGENQKVVIKLSQRFEWSGRIYQCEGEFLRDPSKKMHSIPISKTFKITQSIIQ